MAFHELYNSISAVEQNTASCQNTITGRSTSEKDNNFTYKHVKAWPETDQAIAAVL
jgi:hypothetical protein